MEGAGQGVRGLECPTKGRLDFSRELDRSPAGWGTACTVIPRPQMGVTGIPPGDRSGAGQRCWGHAKRWLDVGMAQVWPASLRPAPVGLQGAGDQDGRRGAEGARSPPACPKSPRQAV